MTSRDRQSEPEQYVLNNHTMNGSEITDCIQQSQWAGGDRINQSQTFTLTPVIPSSCVRFTIVATVTCVGQLVALHEIIQLGCRSHSTPSHWHIVRARLSGSTKYSSPRVSLHRETQGQTAQRGDGRSLLGDKSTVRPFHVCLRAKSHPQWCHLYNTICAHLLQFALMQSEQKIKPLKTKCHLAESWCGSSPNLHFHFIQGSTEDKLEFTGQINMQKNKPGFLPLPHPTIHFFHSTTSFPQQQDPKHICKHIPLKWRADFWEINWAHAKIQ